MSDHRPSSAPLTTDQRLWRAELQEARHADFERWQYDRRLRDEITDQSERLASPMTNTFDYSLRDGELYTDLNEPLTPVFEDGYNVALHQAKHDPRWEFEATRRGIELGEISAIKSYAHQLGEGVRMTSQSLDGSDWEAMRAVAAAIGHRLPVDYPGSEAVLGNLMWIPEGLVVMSPIADAVRYDGVDIGGYDKKRNKLIVRIITAHGTPLAEHQALIDRIRDAYDEVLTARTGHKHYAGRPGITNEDARSFIEKQGDLLDAHMQVINSIFAATSDKGERNRLAASHRYNLAAALDDRLAGRQVTSLHDSGATARAEGKTFDGDCPPAETAVTAAQQGDRLTGRKLERWTRGKCRNCTRITDVWKVENGGCNVCRACAGAHTRHGDVGLESERKKAAAERARLERATARARKLGAVATQAATAHPAEKPKMRLGIGGMVAVPELVDAA